jgi:hypothetical protein
MDNDAPVGSSAFIGGDLTALARRHHGAAGSAGDASQPHRKHIDAARSSSYPTSTSSKLKRRRKCTDLANDDFPHEQYDNGLLPPPPSPLPQNVFGGPPQSRETEPIDAATMEAHIASPTTARTDFSSTAMPDEHAAHHAPTVSDIRNQDARLVDARHAWEAKTVAPSASRACEFHDSDDDADSLVELLNRESSPGLSPAGVGGSQGTASHVHSSQVDKCKPPREEGFLLAHESTVSSSSDALEARRELSPRIVEPVVALALVSDDGSEAYDTFNELRLKNLIAKLGGPLGSSEHLSNTSLPSTQASVSLRKFIDATSADFGDLPIYIRLQEYWQDCFDYLNRVVSGSCVSTFYVGATMDPRRRWAGHGVGSGFGRGAMRGHCESYSAMHLVALMMGSDESRYVEASLIRAGQGSSDGGVNSTWGDARQLLSMLESMLVDGRCLVADSSHS